MMPMSKTPEAQFLVIGKAADFSKQAFAGMTDRAGQPSFLHADAVASMLEDPLDIIVAYLHDVCEDTLINLAQIYAEFGADVSKPVFLLTRPKGMPWSVYTRRIMMQVIDPFDYEHHARAARVKIKDMTHNLSRMDEKMADSSRNGDMYRETIVKMEEFLALPYNAK